MSILSELKACLFCALGTSPFTTLLVEGGSAIHTELTFARVNAAAAPTFAGVDALEEHKKEKQKKKEATRVGQERN